MALLHLAELHGGPCLLPAALQALGFTENDSAGQTNIFAVEPKSYVAGSSADTTSAGGQTTLLIAGVAAAAAAAAVAGGLLGNSGPTGEPVLAFFLCGLLPAWQSMTCLG